MTKEIEFGLNTFGDLPVDENGRLFTHPEAIRQVVKEGVLADKLGIDAIILGEHHRPEFSVSTPETVLAGIATKTERIKLASGVTVLSSDDPVRVYQRFSTLDALSNGRAEVILGRGAFTESFPLFGYDMKDYEILFEEKIELFSKLLVEKPVTWSGTTRSGLKDADVYPKTESGHLRTAVGIGGTPQSVVRAAVYGFPLIIGIIGGSASRFAPYVELYHRVLKERGRDPLPVGIHSPGFIADTDEEAIKIGWPAYETYYNRAGGEHGLPPMTFEHFKNEVDNGSFYFGSPETVARKIAKSIKSLGAERFDLVYGSGPMPVAARIKMIKLYATKVIPRVRELLDE